MIPKTINYCWFGRKRKPNSVKKNIASWRKYCPDYKIIEWNEDNFHIQDYKFTKQAYNDKKWAFVSDYARLKIIYDNGGIYLDTDVELIKNLDDLLYNDAYVAIQRKDKLCNTGLGFGAVPKNKIIEKMMNLYSKIDYASANKEKIACPILNNQVLESLGYSYSNQVIKMSNISVYPPEYFDPYSPGFSDDVLTNNTYTIHHYDASWVSGKEKIKRKLVNFIGLKNFNAIKRMLGK